MSHTERENVFITAVGKEKRYRVKIVGTERLLMDQMTQEEIVDVLIRKKRVPPKTDRSLEAMAADNIYRDAEKRIGMPTVNLLAALCEAGKFIKWGAGKTRLNVTKADGKTMLFSFLRIEEEFLRFDLPKEGVNEEGWTVDVRKGKLSDGTACGVIRPCFKKWSSSMHVCVDYYTSEVTEELIADLFFRAGKVIGLGAFRPTCKGPFGTFKVSEWEEAPLAEEGSQKAA